MKSLQKIIAFFLLIFASGILITYVSVTKTLKKQTYQETVKVANDSLHQFKSTKKIV